MGVSAIDSYGTLDIMDATKNTQTQVVLSDCRTERIICNEELDGTQAILDWSTPDLNAYSSFWT